MNGSDASRVNTVPFLHVQRSVYAPISYVLAGVFLDGDARVN